MRAKLSSIFGGVKKKVLKTLFIYSPNNIKISAARKLGVHVGENCLISNFCTLSSEPYLISIGDHCRITSGVDFVTHDGSTWCYNQNDLFHGSRFGPIMIRDNCFIGMNTTILYDVEIGPNSIIGAGSVVTKNIPANSVYAGNPARFIYTYDEFLQKLKARDTGNFDDYTLDEMHDLLKNKFKTSVTSILKD